MLHIFSFAASHPAQKAQHINILSLSRPHMLAFHLSWIGYFAAFLLWYALPPLFPFITATTNVTVTDVADSNIAGLASTVLFRILVGPLTDRYGPQRTMAAILILGAFLLMFAALVTDGSSLIIVRFFVGLLGASFVPCQAWTTLLFSPNVLGTANAIVGGWGSVGAGITYLIMPQLASAFAIVLAPNVAWRVCLVVPVVICIGVGIGIYMAESSTQLGSIKGSIEPSDLNDTKNDQIGSEDGEKGRLEMGEVEVVLHDDHPIVGLKDGILEAETNKRDDAELEIKAGMPEVGIDGGAGAEVEIKDDGVIIVLPSVPPPPKIHPIKKIARGFQTALQSPSVMILMIHFALSFGIELAIYNILGQYYTETFSLSTTTASYIASIFGLLNVFSRGLGGVLSDYAGDWRGIEGRLLAQLFVLGSSGGLLILFSFMNTLSSSITVMVFMGVFIQMGSGTTFGLVPYVVPGFMGSVSGLVGAFGTLGGALFGVAFKVYVNDLGFVFAIMGYCVIAGAVTTCLFLRVAGESLLGWIVRMWKV